MRRTALLAHAAAAAALALVLGVDLGAQDTTYNAVDSGGPLWWLPANDDTYSRHHDLWYVSPVEELAEGVATSFPAPGGDEVWLTSVSGAPPNSACDLANGEERMAVGPPYPNDGVTAPRTSRTPDDDGGIQGGLQFSLMIGEWWQGMRYLGYWETGGPSQDAHFPYQSQDDLPMFGYFDVRARKGDGTMDRPPLLDRRTDVGWIPPDQTDWRLRGRGGFVMPCAGTSLVLMHGTERDGAPEKAFPNTPVGADGEECWATARPFILRSNSEARCEPDLRHRYEKTERFYRIFDAASQPREEHLVPYYGVTRYPRISPYYRLATNNPNHAIIARRGEVALFTASELADADVPLVPWSTPPYPGRSAGARRARLEDLFLSDPDARQDAFDGRTVRVYRSDTDEYECLELGDAGWDARHGTFDPQCGDGTRYNSEYTGRVNHEEMGHGTARREREAGPVDNRIGFGTTGRARRPDVDPSPPPPGYAWFEHRYATLGCLYLQAEVAHGLTDWAETQREGMLAGARYYMSFWRGLEACPACETDPVTGETDCDARLSCELHRAENRRLEEHVRAIAFGWELIRQYRAEVMPEMEAALRAASPYPYEVPSTDLEWRGRGLPGGCVTNLPGRDTYNESVVPSYPASAPGGDGGYVAGAPTGYVAQNMIPRQGGAMWYDPHPFAQGPGSSRGLGRGQLPGAGFPGTSVREAGTFGQFADVVGRTTGRSEALLRDGVSYPRFLRLRDDYNQVRLGDLAWRELACPAVHGGYYGQGLTAVGPLSVDHREAPEEAWKRRDARIRLGDIVRTQYSSGTPCVGDDAYDARGADGSRRCYDPARRLGAYARRHLNARRFVLDYSGDAGRDTGAPGESRATRPTPYFVVPGSEYLLLDLYGSFFWSLTEGYRSLDIERERIWSGYGPIGTPWLRSMEALEGTPPGWCTGEVCDYGAHPPDGSTVPLDRAEIVHHGPLRFFGAMVPGSSGGCTIRNRRTADVDGRPVPFHVLFEDQSVVCLLPVDAVPDGRCPGPGLRGGLVP